MQGAKGATNGGDSGGGGDGDGGGGDGGGDGSSTCSIAGGTTACTVTPSDAERSALSLLLKLLARRGMALCQLTRYDEAVSDYTKAVELDPSNAQLKHDLELIEAARAA